MAATGQDALLEHIREHWENTPYWRLLGITLEEARPGYALLRLPVRQEVQNAGGGSVHGGALASLVDVAVTALLWTVYDVGSEISGHTTAELNVSYLAPGRGGAMHAEARLVRKGGTLMTGDVDVKDDQGELVAKGRATYRVFRRRETPPKAVR
ncbi:MAG TPA: PaaI family thioesterase [Dehalococcoidia bacterium]